MPLPTRDLLRQRSDAFQWRADMLEVANNEMMAQRDEECQRKWASMTIVPRLSEEGEQGAETRICVEVTRLRDQTALYQMTGSVLAFAHEDEKANHAEDELKQRRVTKRYSVPLEKPGRTYLVYQHPKDVPLELGKAHDVTGCIIEPEITFSRQRAAIHYLPSHPGIDRYLSGRGEESLAYATEHIGQLRERCPVAFTEYDNLNPRQKQAANMLMQPLLEQQVLLPRISGPPGSGKTTVFYVTLLTMRELTRQGLVPFERVLLAAPGNASCIDLAARIDMSEVAFLWIASARMVQSGDHDCVAELNHYFEFWAETFPTSVFAQLINTDRKIVELAKLVRQGQQRKGDGVLTYSRQLQELKRERYQLYYQCFTLAYVVSEVAAATTSQSSTTPLKLKRIWVDEARKVQEMESAVCFANTNEEAAQIAHIGDRNQVRPYSIIHPYDIPYVDAAPRKADVELREVHRSQVQQVQLFNSAYNNELEATRPKPTYQDYVHPVVVVTHEAELSGLNESVTDVNLINQMCEYLMSDQEEGRRPEIADSIVAISPYRNQTRLLSQSLAADVGAYTVDSFQGQQRRIVFISLAADRETAFVQKHRGTSALSRPQQLEVIICSNTFLKAAETNDGLVSVAVTGRAAHKPHFVQAEGGRLTAAQLQEAFRVEIHAEIDAPRAREDTKLTAKQRKKKLSSTALHKRMTALLYMRPMPHYRPSRIAVPGRCVFAASTETEDGCRMVGRFAVTAEYSVQLGIANKRFDYDYRIGKPGVFFVSCAGQLHREVLPAREGHYTTVCMYKGRRADGKAHGAALPMGKAIQEGSFNSWLHDMLVEMQQWVDRPDQRPQAIIFGCMQGKDRSPSACATFISAFTGADPMLVRTKLAAVADVRNTFPAQEHAAAEIAQQDLAFIRRARAVYYQHPVETEMQKLTPPLPSIAVLTKPGEGGAVVGQLQPGAQGAGRGVGKDRVPGINCGIQVRRVRNTADRDRQQDQDPAKGAVWTIDRDTLLYRELASAIRLHGDGRFRRAQDVVDWLNEERAHIRNRTLAAAYEARVYVIGAEADRSMALCADALEILVDQHWRSAHIGDEEPGGVDKGQQGSRAIHMTAAQITPQPDMSGTVRADRDDLYRIVAAQRLSQVSRHDYETIFKERHLPTKAERVVDVYIALFEYSDAPRLAASVHGPRLQMKPGGQLLFTKSHTENHGQVRELPRLRIAARRDGRGAYANCSLDEYVQRHVCLPIFRTDAPVYGVLEAGREVHTIGQFHPDARRYEYDREDDLVGLMHEFDAIVLVGAVPAPIDPAESEETPFELLRIDEALQASLPVTPQTRKVLELLRGAPEEPTNEVPLWNTCQDLSFDGLYGFRPSRNRLSTRDRPELGTICATQINPSQAGRLADSIEMLEMRRDQDTERRMLRERSVAGIFDEPALQILFAAARRIHAIGAEIGEKEADESEPSAAAVEKGKTKSKTAMLNPREKHESEWSLSTFRFLISLPPEYGLTTEVPTVLSEYRGIVQRRMKLTDLGQQETLIAQAAGQVGNCLLHDDMRRRLNAANERAAAQLTAHEDLIQVWQATHQATVAVVGEDGKETLAKPYYSTAVNKLAQHAVSIQDAGNLAYIGLSRTLDRQSELENRSNGNSLGNIIETELAIAQILASQLPAANKTTTRYAASQQNFISVQDVTPTLPSDVEYPYDLGDLYVDQRADEKINKQIVAHLPEGARLFTPDSRIYVITIAASEEAEYRPETIKVYVACGIPARTYPTLYKTLSYAAYAYHDAAYALSEPTKVLDLYGGRLGKPEPLSDEAVQRLRGIRDDLRVRGIEVDRRYHRPFVYRDEVPTEAKYTLTELVPYLRWRATQGETFGHLPHRETMATVQKEVGLSDEELRAWFKAHDPSTDPPAGARRDVRPTEDGDTSDDEAGTRPERRIAQLEWYRGQRKLLGSIVDEWQAASGGVQTAHPSKTRAGSMMAIQAETKEGGERDDYHVIYGARSPYKRLSTFYKQKLTIAGRSYNCGEQFLNYVWALREGSTDLAEKIMAMTNPGDMKKATKGLSREQDERLLDFQLYVWFAFNDAREDPEGKDACRELRATAGKRLYEAGANDKYWCTGLSAEDTKTYAEGRQGMPGRNMMGKQLQHRHEQLLSELATADAAARAQKARSAEIGTEVTGEEQTEAATEPPAKPPAAVVAQVATQVTAGDRDEEEIEEGDTGENASGVVDAAAPAKRLADKLEVKDDACFVDSDKQMRNLEATDPAIRQLFADARRQPERQEASSAPQQTVFEELRVVGGVHQPDAEGDATTLTIATAALGADWTAPDHTDYTYDGDRHGAHIRVLVRHFGVGTLGHVFEQIMPAWQCGRQLHFECLDREARFITEAWKGFARRQAHVAAVAARKLGSSGGVTLHLTDLPQEENGTAAAGPARMTDADAITDTLMSSRQDFHRLADANDLPPSEEVLRLEEEKCRQTARDMAVQNTEVQPDDDTRNRGQQTVAAEDVLRQVNEAAGGPGAPRVTRSLPTQGDISVGSVGENRSQIGHIRANWVPHVVRSNIEGEIQEVRPLPHDMTRVVEGIAHGPDAADTLGALAEAIDDYQSRPLQASALGRIGIDEEGQHDSQTGLPRRCQDRFEAVCLLVQWVAAQPEFQNAVASERAQRDCDASSQENTEREEDVRQLGLGADGDESLRLLHSADRSTQRRLLAIDANGTRLVDVPGRGRDVLQKKVASGDCTYKDLLRGHRRSLCLSAREIKRYLDQETNLKVTYAEILYALRFCPDCLGTENRTLPLGPFLTLVSQSGILLADLCELPDVTAATARSPGQNDVAPVVRVRSVIEIGGGRSDRLADEVSYDEHVLPIIEQSRKDVMAGQRDFPIRQIYYSDTEAGDARPHENRGIQCTRVPRKFSVGLSAINLHHKQLRLAWEATTPQCRQQRLTAAVHLQLASERVKRQVKCGIDMFNALPDDQDFIKTEEAKALQSENVRREMGTLRFKQNCRKRVWFNGSVLLDYLDGTLQNTRVIWLDAYNKHRLCRGTLVGRLGIVVLIMSGGQTYSVALHHVFKEKMRYAVEENIFRDYDTFVREEQERLRRFLKEAHYHVFDVSDYAEGGLPLLPGFREEPHLCNPTSEEVNTAIGKWVNADHYIGKAQTTPWNFALARGDGNGNGARGMVVFQPNVPGDVVMWEVKLHEVTHSLLLVRPTCGERASNVLTGNCYPVKGEVDHVAFFQQAVENGGGAVRSTLWVPRPQPPARGLFEVRARPQELEAQTAQEDILTFVEQWVHETECERSEPSRSRVAQVESVPVYRCPAEPTGHTANGQAPEIACILSTAVNLVCSYGLADGNLAGVIVERAVQPRVGDPVIVLNVRGGERAGQIRLDPELVRLGRQARSEDDKVQWVRQQFTPCVGAAGRAWRDVDSQRNEVGFDLKLTTNEPLHETLRRLRAFFTGTDLHQRATADLPSDMGEAMQFGGELVAEACWPVRGQAAGNTVAAAGAGAGGKQSMHTDDLMAFGMWPLEVRPVAPPNEVEGGIGYLPTQRRTSAGQSARVAGGAEVPVRRLQHIRYNDRLPRRHYRPHELGKTRWIDSETDLQRVFGGREFKVVILRQDRFVVEVVPSGMPIAEYERRTSKMFDGPDQEVLTTSRAWALPDSGNHGFPCHDQSQKRVVVYWEPGGDPTIVIDEMSHTDSVVGGDDAAKFLTDPRLGYTVYRPSTNGGVTEYNVAGATKSSGSTGVAHFFQVMFCFRDEDTDQCVFKEERVWYWPHYSAAALFNFGSAFCSRHNITRGETDGQPEAYFWMRGADARHQAQAVKLYTSEFIGRFGGDDIMSMLRQNNVFGGQRAPPASKQVQHIHTVVAPSGWSGPEPKRPFSSAGIDLPDELDDQARPGAGDGQLAQLGPTYTVLPGATTADALPEVLRAAHSAKGLELKSKAVGAIGTYAGDPTRIPDGSDDLQEDEDNDGPHTRSWGRASRPYGIVGPNREQPFAEWLRPGESLQYEMHVPEESGTLITCGLTKELRGIYQLHANHDGASFAIVPSDGRVWVHLRYTGAAAVAPRSRVKIKYSVVHPAMGDRQVEREAYMTDFADMLDSPVEAPQVQQLIDSRLAIQQEKGRGEGLTTTQKRKMARTTQKKQQKLIPSAEIAVTAAEQRRQDALHGAPPTPDVPIMMGDLRDFGGDVLLHQTHCRPGNGTAAGVAEQLFLKWPNVNVYDAAHPQTLQRHPGTAIYTTNESGPAVLHLNAQRLPGKAAAPTNRDDPSDRLWLFERALHDAEKKIRKVRAEIGAAGRWKIGIPYGIGCGLAGGHWPDYQIQVALFAERVQDIADVNFVKLPGASVHDARSVEPPDGLVGETKSVRRIGYFAAKRRRRNQARWSRELQLEAETDASANTARKWWPTWNGQWWKWSTEKSSDAVAADDEGAVEEGAVTSVGETSIPEPPPPVPELTELTNVLDSGATATDEPRVVNLRTAEPVSATHRSVSDRIKAWVARDPEKHVYIGRPSEWGNPHKVGRDGDDAEAVVRKYREHIMEWPDLADRIAGLSGKVLGCWCDPEPCHGHVLVELYRAQQRSSSGDWLAQTQYGFVYYPAEHAPANLQQAGAAATNSAARHELKPRQIAALARYKHRADLATEANSQDVAKEKLKDDAEQEQWYANQKAVDAQSCEWRNMVGSQILEHIHPQLVYDLALRWQCEIATAILAVLMFAESAADEFYLYHHLEGHEVLKIRDGLIDLSAFDLSKAPTKQPKLLPLKGLMLRRVLMLLMREVFMGLMIFATLAFGTIIFCCNVFRAFRKGKSVGRLVIDFRPVNPMTRHTALPPISLHVAFGYLEGDKKRYYFEIDVAKAFNTLTYTPRVAVWLGLQCAQAQLISLRGQLGLKFMPALWGQRSNDLNKAVVHPEAIAEFEDKLREATEKKRAAADDAATSLFVNLPAEAVTRFVQTVKGHSPMNFDDNTESDENYVRGHAADLLKQHEKAVAHRGGRAVPATETPVRGEEASSGATECVGSETTVRGEEDVGRTSSLEPEGSEVEYVDGPCQTTETERDLVAAQLTRRTVDGKVQLRAGADPNAPVLVESLVEPSLAAGDDNELLKPSRKTDDELAFDDPDEAYWDPLDEDAEEADIKFLNDFRERAQGRQGQLRTESSGGETVDSDLFKGREAKDDDGATKYVSAGSGLAEYLREFTFVNILNRFSANKAYTFTQAQTDDVAAGAAHACELFAMFVVIMNVFRWLQIKSSLRKLRLGTVQCESLAHTFRFGRRQACKDKYSNIMSWDLDMNSAAELASLIGVMGYIAHCWGHRYHSIVGALSPYLRLAGRQFRQKIMGDPAAVAALNLIKNGCANTPMRAIPWEAVLEGTRLLLIFVDANLFGASFVVCTLAKLDARLLTRDNIYDCARRGYFWIHDIDSSVYPRVLRWMAALEQEAHGLRRYKRRLDVRFRGVPRIVIFDHKNLSDLTRTLHSSSNAAATGWLVELLLWERDRGLRLMMGNGDPSTHLADLPSRMLSSIRLAKKEYERALCHDSSQLLQTLFPVVRRVNLKHSGSCKTVKQRDIAPYVTAEQMQRTTTVGDVIPAPSGEAADEAKSILRTCKTGLEDGYAAALPVEGSC